MIQLCLKPETFVPCFAFGVVNCVVKLSEDQTQLRDPWSGMKVKILYCLFENSRFVLSSTLTFAYAIVSFFSAKNYKSIYRNGDKRPNCFNGSYWLFLLQKEIILLDFT